MKNNWKTEFGFKWYDDIRSMPTHEYSFPKHNDLGWDIAYFLIALIVSSLFTFLCLALAILSKLSHL